MKKLFLAFLFVSQFAYAITGNSVWRIPSGGSLPAWGPVNLADGTNAITGALASKSNLPAVGQQISSSSGSFITSSGSPTAVTNLSITFTTTGRPVIVGIQPVGGSQGRFGGAQDVYIYRDGSAIFDWLVTATTTFIPPPGIDVGASAGSHTWDVRIASQGGSVNATNVVLYGYEL